MEDAEYFDELEGRLSSHVSERMLELLEVREGMRVLDLACGRGEPALRLARRVGAAGAVVGLDVSEPALELARRRAMAEALHHVSFRRLEAERADEGGSGFDGVTSRWGLMYVREPQRALEAAHRALRPGGRLVAALWTEPAQVSWWRVPREVTERFATLPPRDFRGPSPFRFGAPGAFERALEAAGLVVEHAEELETSVVEAVEASGIVTWVRVVLGSWAEAVPVAHRDAWARTLEEEIERHRRGGVVELGGVTRLVVGRRAEEPGPRDGRG